ncbi:MAG: FG-GAP repeat domain-containing protein [Pirellulales bacterium]
MSAADVDGDGDMDVLTASADDTTVRWYENLGGPTISFAEHVLATDRRRSNFVLGADINGDGYTDILSSSNSDSMIAYYENSGTSPPTFTERVVTIDANGPLVDPEGFSSHVRQVAVADLDGDGDLDISAASVDDDRVAWYENLGGPVPAWQPRVLTNTLDGARAVHNADLDGDGDVDVIAGAWFGDSIRWYDNDGASSPTFTERTLMSFDNPPGPIADIAQIWRVFTADLDGDNDLDVLAMRRKFGVEWYENDGGVIPSFDRHVIVPGKYTPTGSMAYIGKSVFAADLDQDGDIDAMSASVGDDKIAWYENLGGDPLEFNDHVLTVDPNIGENALPDTINGIADGARSVFAVDLDGDGDTDILWGSKYNDTIGWYENQLNVLLLGDMDGDGDVDFDDSDAFELALNWPQDYENQFGVRPEARGDTNGDGDFDFDDIAGFITIVNPPLTAQVQSIPEPSIYVLSAMALLGFFGRGWPAGKRQ